MSKRRRLTKKQEAFVAEFLSNGGNATKAAIAAGYSKRAAATEGWRLLRHAKVGKALADASSVQEHRAQAKLNFDTDKCRERHLAIFALAMQIAKGASSDRDALAALRTANTALESAGKTVGAYLDRREHTVNVTGTVRLEHISTADLAAYVEGTASAAAASRIEAALSNPN